MKVNGEFFVKIDLNFCFSITRVMRLLLKCFSSAFFLSFGELDNLSIHLLSLWKREAQTFFLCSTEIKDIWILNYMKVSNKH